MNQKPTRTANFQCRIVEDLSDRLEIALAYAKQSKTDWLEEQIRKYVTKRSRKESKHGRQNLAR